MFILNVTKSTITILQDEILNKGEYNVTECHFKFSNEYQGLVKKAVFFILDKKIKMDINNENICKIPKEVFEYKGNIEIGVYAYATSNGSFQKVYSPTPVSKSVADGSYVENADNTIDPTPTELEQIQSSIQTNRNDIVDLNNDIENLYNDKVDKRKDYDLSKNDFNDSYKEKLDNIQSKANVNKIESISKNGIPIPIDENKNVNVVIPISNSELENGENYINKDYADSQTASLSEKISDNSNKISNLNEKLKNYSLISETGSMIDLIISSSDFKMKALLKDKNSNIIYTSNEIDLPIETMVVDATYDNANKQIVLLLQNGNTTRFDVADLVNGLVSTNELNNILSNYYTKKEVDDLLLFKANSNDVYSKSEVDDFLSQKANNNDIPIKVSELENDKNYASKDYVDHSQSNQDKVINSLIDMLPKVSGTGEEITLDNTGDTLFTKFNLQGNTSQEVIQGEVGLEVEDTSIYVDDVDTSKENYITIEGSTEQKTTEGNQLLTLKNSTFVADGITKTITNSSVTFSGTPKTTYSNTDGILFDKPLLANNTYSVSYEGGADIYLWLRNSSFTTVVALRLNDNTKSLTFTLSEDVVDYKIGVENMIVGTPINVTVHPMLVSGNVAKDFEPYTNGASPNLDYPQNVDVVTGNLKVKVEGKNLFDKNNYNVASGFSGNDNLLHDSQMFESGFWVKLKPNTTYTLSISKLDTATDKIIGFYDQVPTSDGIRWSSRKFYTIDTTNINYTFTTDTSNIYMHAKFYNEKNLPTYTIEEMLDSVQLEQNNQATTYEEYKGATYEINLGSIELCRIDNYKDGFYKSKIDNNWYLHKEIGKVVLDGTNNMFNEKSGQLGNTYGYHAKNFIPSPALTEVPLLLSNRFIPKSWNDRVNYLDNAIVFCYETTTRLNFRFGTSSDITTLELANDYLKKNNVLLYGILAEPVDIKIIDTTLISQLETLYQAQIHSVTHINTETSNLLPFINLKYNVVTASPSPERPSEVEVVTGLNKIKVSNKNLFDKENANYLLNSYINSDNIITNGSDVNRIAFLRCKSNTTYEISLNAFPTYLDVANTIDIPDIGMVVTNFQTRNANSTTPIVITTENTANYLVIRFRAFNDNYTLDECANNLQIEEGSTATEYIPHQEQVFEVNLGSLELCKIEDFKDYFYEKNGKWYKHKKIDKVVLDGSEVWYIQQSTIRLFFCYFFPNGQTGSSVGYCNYFKYVLHLSLRSNHTICWSSSTISICYDELEDVNELKSWLNNHNIELYFILEKPVEEEIINATLINQLDNLKNVMSYYNQTNITQESSNKPFILDVSTIRDLSNIFELIGGIN